MLLRVNMQQNIYYAHLHTTHHYCHHKKKVDAEVDNEVGTEQVDTASRHQKVDTEKR